MNPYFIVILVALLATYSIESLAEVLNLRSLDAPLPREFEGVFDPEKYRKAQEYTRARTKFGLCTSTFSLLALLTMWLSGGFNWLDLRLRGLHLPQVATGLLYIGVLFLASDIIHMPFSLYSTFVIEASFGFNRTTLRTYAMDRIKGYALTLVLGAPLLALLLTLLGALGPKAWPWCWATSCLFVFFIRLIAPTWIMPLFNKFIPLEEGELRRAIFDYARSVDFPLVNIYFMDGSKRSSKTNAFFTGFGKNKRIALFDTLVEKHSVPEMVAILAHEIGHYKKKHIVKGLMLDILNYGIIFYLLSKFLWNRALFDAFRMDHASVYAGLIFCGLLYTPVSFMLSIALNLISRHNEFEADRYSVETYKQPEAMLRAFKTLSVSNLAHLTPDPFYVFLNYSHPPILERIKAIRAHLING